MWLYVNSFGLCVGAYLVERYRYERNELTYSHIPTLFITNLNQHSNSVT